MNRYIRQIIFVRCAAHAAQAAEQPPLVIA